MKSTLEIQQAGMVSLGRPDDPVSLYQELIAQKRGPARATEINLDKFKQVKIILDIFRYI
jgi:hypothetical protein